MNKLMSHIPIVIMATFLSSPVFANCTSPENGTAELSEVRNGLYTVVGKLADFDPCHASVSYQVPKSAGKPPLMIALHGGGGIDDLKNTTPAFAKLGMAVLSFDAFAMNFPTNYRQVIDLNVAQRTSLESRQRMIFSAALGAYQWAKQQKDIDTNNIYIYGISNGAAVALNLAAVVDPKHVKAVFAEGAPPVGLGFPKDVRVPTYVVYGTEDNFGGTAKTEKGLWNIKYPCRFNAPYGLNEQDKLARPPSAIPRGYSDVCSWQVNPTDIAMSTKEWYEKESSTGAPLKMIFYKNAAHNMFIEDKVVFMHTRLPSSNIRVETSIGGEQSARDSFLNDIKGIVGSKQE